MKIVKRILAALAAVALIAVPAVVSASATEYITEPVNETATDSGFYFLVLSLGESVRVVDESMYDSDSQEEYYGEILYIDGFTPESGYNYDTLNPCFNVSDGTYESYCYITISGAAVGADYYYYRINRVSHKLFVFVYNEMDLSDVSPTVSDVYYAWGQLDNRLSVPDTDEIYKNGYDAGYSYGHISGMDDGYEIGKADGYSVGLEKGAISSDAYKRGYDAGFNSVIQTSDGAAVSGMFSGIFAAFFDGYRTVASGVSVGGISVGAVVSTMILIAVVVVVVRFILKFVKS